MRARRLFIAIPCYTGRVCAETLQTVIDGLSDAGRNGWQVTVGTFNGDGRIIQVRNRIVADFLYGGFSDLLMLDDDVGCAPGGLLRLLSHPVDVVAGVYRGRRDDEVYPMRWLEKDGTFFLEQDGHTGLIEVASVAAGFLRITRACAERMTQYYGDGRYQTPAADGGIVWRLFDDLPWDKGDWGEDFAFCQRWRDIGGKVWVDPSLELCHIGSKPFAGCLQEWLARQATAGRIARGDPSLSDAVDTRSRLANGAASETIPATA